MPEYRPSGIPTESVLTERVLTESVLTERERKRLTKPENERAIIFTLAFTGLIAAFMQTLVTPIIPQLPQLLNTTPSDAT